MSRTVILHYHLFKNAGTSLDQVLRRNFGAGWVSGEFHGIPPLKNHRAVQGWMQEHPGAVAFSSHTAMGPLPELPGVAVHPVLILRDPLDRIRSAYGFERKQTAETLGARIARRSDFAGYVRERLDRPKDRFCRNFHCRRLAAFCPAAGLSEFERATRALESWAGTLGLVEHFGATLALLGARLAPVFPGFRSEEAHANRGAVAGASLAQKHALIRAELGDELWQRLAVENARDMQLHALAFEGLARALAAQGLPVPARKHPPDPQPMEGRGLLPAPAPPDLAETAEALAGLLAEGVVLGLVRGSDPAASGARAVLASPDAAAPGGGAALMRRQDFTRFFTGSAEGSGPVPARIREGRDGVLGRLAGPAEIEVRTLPGRAGDPLLWDILGLRSATAPVLALAGPEAADVTAPDSFAGWAAALEAGRIGALWYDGVLWRRAAPAGKGGG